MDGEVEWLVRHIRVLINGYMERQGYLDDEAGRVGESSLGIAASIGDPLRRLLARRDTNS